MRLPKAVKRSTACVPASTRSTGTTRRSSRPGLVTPGLFDLRPYVHRYGLPEDLTGLRAIDVGTFEGFWAFELERRGAHVTALDVDRIQELDWPPRLRPRDDARRGEGFELAHAALGSSVERVGMSIYEATPERLGDASTSCSVGRC